MKPFKLLVSTAVLAGNAFLVPLHASSSWNYVGLKGETINVILPMTDYCPDGIMVGTQTGIRNFDYHHWIPTWSGLPVHDIIKTPNGYLLAAAGNGSDSDGVYIGQVTAIAEPGTMWGFSLLVKCPRPTALAYQAIPGLDTACTGRLYVGNAEGVWSGYLCTGLGNVPVCGLSKIAGAPNPFYITSMIIGSDDNMLYAGGRNDIFPQPGPGPIEYSWLLQGNAGGLSAIKKMNVTSIVEIPPRTMAMSPGSFIRDFQLIAVATVDSGIQLFEKNSPSGGAHSPVQQEPVVSVVPFQTNDIMHWTELIAATPSGVFRHCPPTADCEWSKMYGLPGSPSCLAHHQASLLWAGTDSGVFLYNATTGIQLKDVSRSSSPHGAESIRADNGSILFEFDNGCGRNGALTLYDTRGRCVKTRILRAFTQTHASVSGLGKGLFLYRISIENRIVQAGRIMSQ